MVKSSHLGGGLLCPPRPSTRPHLQAPLPGPSPSISPCRFCSSCSWVNPKAHFSNHQNSQCLHPISCQGSRICFSAPTTSISCLLSSYQTSLGLRARACDRDPSNAKVVLNALWFPDASPRVGSSCRTQRYPWGRHKPCDWCSVYYDDNSPNVSSARSISP